MEILGGLDEKRICVNVKCMDGDSEGFWVVTDNILWCIINKMIYEVITGRFLDAFRVFWTPTSS